MRILGLSSNFTNSFSAGEVFAFGKSFSNNADRGGLYTYGGVSNTHYTWSNGAIYESFGTNDRLGYFPTTGLTNADTKTGIAANTSFTYNALDWNLHNVYSATNNWGINVNFKSLVNTISNTVSFTKSDAFILIGASPSYIFYGQIPETFLYNRVLSATERQRVNTYMSIKYSKTLDQTANTNYLSSKSTIIWNAVDNSLYKNHIFGIGKDAGSALDQRQSYSDNWNVHTNVRFGLGTINESGNTLNTTTFTADQQFLIIGAKLTGSAGQFTQTSDTDIPTAYVSIGINPRRWNQVYKGHL